MSTDIRGHKATQQQQHSFSRSVPAEAGCLFVVAACVHLRGEPVSIFLWLVLLFLIDVNDVCLSRITQNRTS